MCENPPDTLDCLQIAYISLHHTLHKIEGCSRHNLGYNIPLYGVKLSLYKAP